MNIGWTPISCHRHVFAEFVQMGVWGGGLPHRRDKPLRYFIKPRRGYSQNPGQRGFDSADKPLSGKKNTLPLHQSIKIVIYYGNQS